MSVIVVGGQSRNVGKSSIVAGLISAMRECHWTAIKISGHSHEAAGRTLISHETDGSGHADTARFLQAGAERVYWVRGGGGSLAQAIPQIRQIAGESTATIIESNSIMRFLDPDLYLLVIDPSVQDFKNSAREFLPCVSAYVVNARTTPSLSEIAEGESRFATESQVPPVLPERPSFPVCQPEYISPELLAFVRERLARDKEQFGF